MRSLILFLMVAVLTAVMPASTIFFEDFENGIWAQSQTSGDLEGTQFRVVGGSVDVVTPDDAYTSICSTPASGTCIDMVGGGTGGWGVIETINEIQLDPGEYTLTFDLLGWFFVPQQLSTTASVQVDFGSLLSEEFTRTGNQNPYDTIVRSLLVIEPFSGRIRFTTTNANAWSGVVLDNVKLTANVPDTPTSEAPIPEPSSWMLMALGLAAITFRPMMRGLAGTRDTQ
jgi:hypothetical protein